MIGGSEHGFQHLVRCRSVDHGAVLEANLKLKVIADGYDPTIGIMHHGRRGRGTIRWTGQVSADIRGQLIRSSRSRRRFSRGCDVV